MGYNAFATGNPFLGRKLLEISIGRGLGTSMGLRSSIPHLPKHDSEKNFKKRNPPNKSPRPRHTIYTIYQVYMLQNKNEIPTVLGSAAPVLQKTKTPTQVVYLNTSIAMRLHFSYCCVCHPTTKYVQCERQHHSLTKKSSKSGQKKNKKITKG